MRWAVLVESGGPGALDIAAVLEVLTERAFWQIIGRSRTMSGNNKEVQRAVLVEHLSRREDSTIRDFDHLYFEKRMDAYRYDIWDVVSLLSGGCGDDSFSDFMDGLVACGKRIYTDVLHDPEALLKHDEALDFHEMYFGLTAADALAKKLTLDMDKPDERNAVEKKLAPHRWPKRPAGRRSKLTLKAAWSKYPKVAARLQASGELSSLLDD